MDSLFEGVLEQHLKKIGLKRTHIWIMLYDFKHFTLYTTYIYNKL